MTVTETIDAEREVRRERGAAPERRCLVTGEVRPRAELMRFVVGPDDIVVPDLEGRLPGRGLWLTGRGDIVAAACAKRAFSRGAKRNVTPMTGPSGESLAAFVEAELLRRAEATLSMARKAGAFVSGFEKVRGALSELEQQGAAAVLLCACDAGTDGREKMARLAARAGNVARIELFDATTLGRISGREHAVHALVLPGAAARRVLEAAARYRAYRGEGAEIDLDVMD
jgi:predicted RNA-binding protein YlxR (DUF448 family)